MISIRTALVALTFCHSVLAQNAPQTLAPPPENEFSARLLLTSDSKQLLADYAAGKPVRIADGNTTPFRPSFKVMYQVSGCAVDSAGLCNVTATVDFFAPGGQSQAKYFKGPGNPHLDIVAKEAPPSKGHWKIAEIGEQPFFFDPQHAALGDYLLLATFTDHNRGAVEPVTTWQVIRIAGDKSIAFRTFGAPPAGQFSAGFAYTRPHLHTDFGNSVAFAGPTPVVSTTTPGEILAGLPMIAGCKQDSKGACNVTADIAIIDPKGQQTPLQRDVKVWNSAAPAAGNWGVPARVPTMTMERQDPPGDYQAVVTFKDVNAKVTREVRYVFRLLGN